MSSSRARRSESDSHQPSVRAALREFRLWVRRAERHVTKEDLKLLGPMSVRETVTAFSSKRDRLADWSIDLHARDPEFVQVVVDAARVVGKSWFRYQVQHVDNVPETGPVLLVGNHNGGVMPVDTILTLTALWDRFGPERVVNVLGHDLLAFDPVGRRLAAKLGILRATPQSASAALRENRIVLVYPGSDLDAWRPWWDRDKVQLAQRKGFLRVALQEGVPIVPVVSVGTHEQLFVLSTGKQIAQRLDLERRLRTEAFPIVWALPWGLTSGYLPYLPLPAQTTIAFSNPLRWPELKASDAARQQVLDRCYREVVESMQATLSATAKGRLPLVGDPRRLLPKFLRKLVLDSSDQDSGSPVGRDGKAEGST